jgi:hypothetical protein
MDERDTMRDEYDFTKGVRGKHAYIREGRTNLVLLDPDVVDLFPDSASVNEALRLPAKLARQKTERVTG